MTCTALQTCLLVPAIWPFSGAVLISLAGTSVSIWAKTWTAYFLPHAEVAVVILPTVSHRPARQELFPRRGSCVKHHSITHDTRTASIWASSLKGPKQTMVLSPAVPFFNKRKNICIKQQITGLLCPFWGVFLKTVTVQHKIGWGTSPRYSLKSFTCSQCGRQLFPCIWLLSSCHSATHRSHTLISKAHINKESKADGFLYSYHIITFFFFCFFFFFFNLGHPLQSAKISLKKRSQHSRS